MTNPWFYPVLVGPGERFRRYAPGLHRRGVNMRVVTIQHPGLSRYQEVDGIAVERLPAKSGVRWRERLFVYRLLWRYIWPRERPHVCQFFDVSQWTVPFLFALKLLGIRSLCVFTLLGVGRGSRLRRKLRDRYLRMLFRPFDMIVTSSQVMTEELCRLGLASGRIETIPNGVDLKRFRPADLAERKSLRRKLGIDPEDELVLFIGGILPRKGVDVLLEAWVGVSRGRPGARLLLVGDLNEHQQKLAPYRERLAESAARSMDPTRVLFTGAVQNVEDYLRAADLFVFPSIREGMPNVVPEAMACGVASILTPFRGLPVEFGVAGREYSLVDRRPQPLEAEISRLLEDRDARSALGARGRAWVEEHLDVDRSLDRFASLYRRLAPR